MYIWESIMVIAGPKLTLEVRELLRARGFHIVSYTMSKQPSDLESVKDEQAYVADGRFGKIQFLEVLEYAGLVYLSAERRNHEVVVRKNGQDVHILYGNRNSYSYMQLPFDTFSILMRDSQESRFAMHAIAQIFLKVRSGVLDTEIYQDVPLDQIRQWLAKFSYSQAAEQIGWRWKD